MEPGRAAVQIALETQGVPGQVVVAVSEVWGPLFEGGRGRDFCAGAAAYVLCLFQSPHVPACDSGFWRPM